MKLNDLNEEERQVILEKGTETPFSGKYENHFENGFYLCRQCGAPLYRSSDKFSSNCGWPSFDDEIDGAVEKNLDKDGIRTEILCSRCKGHLGHVFEGEGFTEKNLRHCVNSISMEFVESIEKEKTVYLGGGCFWCIEAVFRMINGVKEVEPGYAGGNKENPSYEEVCGAENHHAEVVKIVFDQTIVSFEKILGVFFDSHDPTTLNRQGNDIGEQYRSVIFTETQDDLDIVENYIEKIKENYKDKIVTETRVISKNGKDSFFKAEDYHKEYYEKHKDAPYCQLVISPKLEKIRKKYLEK